MVRGLIGATVFVAFCAILAASFGAPILGYVLTGFAVSSIVIVAAMGLTLVYGIRGFANFAYGDLMTLGAYTALAVNRVAGLDFIWGAIASFFALALGGILLERVIFSRLEGRGPVAPLVASVGVGLIIQNGIRTIATTRQWSFAVPGVLDIPIVPGLGIHPTRHIATFSVAIAFVLSAHILLKYTNLGKSMRATADNLELAKATGIDTRRVRYAAWAVSCAFASTAGVLLGLNAVISPTVGFDILLLIFAAVIVGGIGSPYGAMLGGLIVGLSQELSAPLLDWLGRPGVAGLEHATAYKVAVPFFIMIAVLLVRPWGIAGRQPAFARRVFFIERLSRILAGQPSAEKVEAPVKANERGG
jgi:branched-chain amino acid transport system permease protein